MHTSEKNMDLDATNEGHAEDHSRWLHRFAILTAVAVFPLIVVGAGVTTQEAGMAFPDWPTSNGHLVNPPGWWESIDTRWEHGHRLIGWVVGMLATTLLILSWRRGGSVRTIGLATFLAIAVQGVLGGLRVTQISTPLAMVHGVWGQICFCLACASTLLTSRIWSDRRAVTDAVTAVALRRTCLAGVSAVFLQLAFGAALRHFGGQHALVLHVVWAIIVMMLVTWLAMWILSEFAGHRLFEPLAKSVAIIMVIQLMLGGATLLITVLGRFDAPFVRWAVPSAHVAGGALLLACTFLLTLSSYRFVRAIPAPEHTASETPMVCV